ncbi:MAG: hypothetical protein PGN23_09090 [Sphingomonas adhaesiva]|uniref:hypothetical protein n=1 Tax=Sphingomonas adhaesiva TaxID=28212 RepID=UPI002FF5F935
MADPGFGDGSGHGVMDDESTFEVVRCIAPHTADRWGIRCVRTGKWLPVTFGDEAMARASSDPKHPTTGTPASAVVA